jgi:hypothetical protein
MSCSRTSSGESSNSQSYAMTFYSLHLPSAYPVAPKSVNASAEGPRNSPNADDGVRSTATCPQVIPEAAQAAQPSNAAVLEEGSTSIVNPGYTARTRGIFVSVLEMMSTTLAVVTSRLNLSTKSRSQLASCRRGYICPVEFFPLRKLSHFTIIFSLIPFKIQPLYFCLLSQDNSTSTMTVCVYTT